jgi:leader peptidase (prepilin peptidase)/N-methyltransferase
MMLMIIVVLFLLGLCLGSFVNALVWRLHEQSQTGKKKAKADLSISKGRSMCPNCHHKLAGKDLVPVLSWLSLGGKCRYCHKPISKQYPLVELLTALLFVASYLWWPVTLHGAQIVIFILWIVLLTGLLALLIYDLRWFLLPNRLIYPLSIIAGLMAIIGVATSVRPAMALLNEILAVLVGGGIFYALFQLSKGKWIGGGDVRLGWMLGLVAGTPGRSLLFIFLASVIGTIVSLPLLASNKLKRSSSIPFGPLLIVGIFITQLFGAAILHWYRYNFINF